MVIQLVLFQFSAVAHPAERVLLLQSVAGLADFEEVFLRNGGFRSSVRWKRVDGLRFENAFPASAPLGIAAIRSFERWMRGPCVPIALAVQVAADLFRRLDQRSQRVLSVLQHACGNRIEFNWVVRC